jgi:hypothetical protein
MFFVQIAVVFQRKRQTVVGDNILFAERIHFFRLSAGKKRGDDHKRQVKNIFHVQRGFICLNAPAIALISGYFKTFSIAVSKLPVVVPFVNIGSTAVCVT